MFPLQMRQTASSLTQKFTYFETHDFHQPFFSSWQQGFKHYLEN
jgi:hypothetical protein